ncbi:hypothetical protein BDZ89DRAFT_941829 [Hymenopellis radicata]|nr:hypothetical protein BDZ89DRAFT_941829 [Hymenopellis radicata]
MNTQSRCVHLTPSRLLYEATSTVAVFYRYPSEFTVCIACSKHLKVASVLGLSDDPRVRRALQADETDIAEILNHVSLSDADREAVIALEGDEAQSFLNVVQDANRGFLFRDPAETTQARRLLVKLSANCYKLPSKLFIEGVTRSEEHATFGGGFGDVFRGTYQGAVVALKRMRIFQRTPIFP